MKDVAAIYLVLIDDNPESRVAMELAVLRARRLGTDVTLASIIDVAGFMQFGSV